MLVLSRKKDERIVVETPHGEKIEILLVESRGSGARIGFEADKSIKIYRKELLPVISEVSK